MLKCPFNLPFYKECSRERENERERERERDRQTDRQTDREVEGSFPSYQIDPLSSQVRKLEFKMSKNCGI